MARPLLLAALVVVLLTGCAQNHGRASDRILGIIVLQGTEQPIAGATLSLTPIAPMIHRARPDPAADPHAITHEMRSGDLGAFAFDGLTAPDGSRRPLLRGWEYELRADAAGFFSTTERVDFEGGEEAVVLQIEIIDDELVHGDGGLFIGEAPPGRVDDMKGTLIKEVLRRLGREEPPGQPLP